MYAREQLNSLFELVESVKTASTEKPGALEELYAEVERLKAINQSLFLGTHEHKHGESYYLYLVPQAQQFGVDEFEQRLQEDYEPERGEFLRIDTMSTPEIIE